MTPTLCLPFCPLPTHTPTHTSLRMLMIDCGLQLMLTSSLLLFIRPFRAALGLSPSDIKLFFQCVLMTDVKMQSGKTLGIHIKNTLMNTHTLPLSDGGHSSGTFQRSFICLLAFSLSVSDVNYSTSSGTNSSVRIVGHHKIRINDKVKQEHHPYAPS